jgi:HEAT repeat protein
MNLTTETVSPAISEREQWFVITARTDPELKRPRPKPVPPPWTDYLQQDIRLENATTQQEVYEDLDQQIIALFEAAREQNFEDGMESEFSKELIDVVKMHRVEAIEALASLLIEEKVNLEVASEALRWLGHMDHPASYRHRLWLLERSLRCSSPRVRDGATLGLAFLDDPQAIPYLKQAIQREQVYELRADMEQALAQLESTHRCHFS